MRLPHDKKFNILHVITRLSIGGVENMLLKVVKGYDKNLFNPSVCCLKEGGGVADELMKTGINVKILNRMRKHGFDIRAVIELYNHIKKNNVHILRTHQYHANLYGRIAGLLAGIPVIIPSFHNLYESPNKPKPHRRLFNYLLAYSSDSLVAVSNTVASDISRFDWINPEKIKTIYNGIAIHEFNTGLSAQDAKKALNLTNGLTIIGSVGRFTEQKGHRYLIEAASKLDNVCVVFVGGGPLLKELKKLAQQYKIKCIFTDFVGPERIPLFLKAFDIFCFPSLWEGFATSLAEAMAAGLPVVVSDIPPHREVVDDAGIFIPLRDSGRLAENLKMLIDNPHLRETLGKKAKERAKFFSIDKTTKTYEDIFVETLKKKKLI